MLIVGEVHTGLLRGPAPVTAEDARTLVDLVVGEPVLVSERPIAYVRSPAVPVGIDCPLIPAGTNRQVRGIGTVLQRTAVTGGHVIQGSAHATIEPAPGTAREPWSYYLARPGVVETVGKAGPDVLAAALAAPVPGTVDLGAIAARGLGRVQDSRPGRSALKSGRTRLRWLVETGAPQVSVRFTLRRDDQRMLHVTVPDGAAASACAVAEDVALHDWLLTSVLAAVRKAAPGVLERGEALRRLTPVIDYLLHLWMPDARGDDLSGAVWAALETRPGFSRQWDTVVARIRDQLSAGAVASLAGLVAAKPAPASPR
ncbi:SCO2521 family protein [Symbioplanes lichenis]|uniref:SCO2521 family protein n=1 Tax=Symbioplanes lichenis TaxID=1629072 RepID=UPI00273A5841|nr:SCO2521 family protein [Actinoplanes lichenis]